MAVEVEVEADAGAVVVVVLQSQTRQRTRWSGEGSLAAAVGLACWVVSVEQRCIEQNHAMLAHSEHDAVVRSLFELIFFVHTNRCTTLLCYELLFFVGVVMGSLVSVFFSEPVVFKHDDLDVNLGLNTDATGHHYVGGADKHNLYHGYGVLLGADNIIYEGMFVHGKRHGAGILYFPNEDRWFGTWRNDKQSDGVFIQNNDSAHVQRRDAFGRQTGAAFCALSANASRPLLPANGHNAWTTFFFNR